MSETTDVRKMVPPLPLESYLTQPGENVPAGFPRREFWGMFGYEGACVDRAIATDSVAAMRWCIEHGIVTSESKTLCNTPLRRLAQQKGATLIAHHLAGLGWPE